MSFGIDQDVLRDFDEGSGTTVFGLNPCGLGMLTEETKRRSSLVSYLNGFIERHGQGLEWTTIRVCHGCGSGGPSKVCAAECPLWMMALGEFQGGGLWLEASPGRGAVIRESWDGRSRFGHPRIPECSGESESEAGIRCRNLDRGRPLDSSGLCRCWELNS